MTEILEFPDKISNVKRNPCYLSGFNEQIIYYKLIENEFACVTIFEVEFTIQNVSVCKTEQSKER